jgi:hypothetical protein
MLASGIMSAIAPEALTQRTNPSIRFVAQPDMEENQRKWGATVAF